VVLIEAMDEEDTVPGAIQARNRERTGLKRT
jgi:hypothetical protein